MNETGQDFEQEFRASMSRLADAAPPAPLAGSVTRRLRRRTMLRRWAGGGATAAALAAVGVFVWMFLAPWGGPRPRTGGATGQAQPSTGATQLVEPLAVTADRKEIDSALRRCFASANIKGNVIVTKSPKEGLSLCYSGGGSAAKLGADLARMLGSFDVVSIEFRQGHLSYILTTDQGS
jgi:hypothetical protein